MSDTLRVRAEVDAGEHLDLVKVALGLPRRLYSRMVWDVVAKERACQHSDQKSRPLPPLPRLGTGFGRNTAAAHLDCVRQRGVVAQHKEALGARAVAAHNLRKCALQT